MENFIEAKGKTREEALLNGLEQLNLSIDQVNIEEYIEKPGFLGLGKSVTVRLSVKEENSLLGAEDFLTQLFSKMGITATVVVEEDDKTVKINIVGDSSGILIGRRGETLDSIQYLTSLVVNKNKENYKKIYIDTENYRQKREEALVSLANRIAAKVSKTGRRVVLEPMNPYERRILHSTLHDHPTVMTVSEGEEPYRRVIIKKKRNNSSDNRKSM